MYVRRSDMVSRHKRNPSFNFFPVWLQVSLRVSDSLQLLSSQVTYLVLDEADRMLDMVGDSDTVVG